MASPPSCNLLLSGGIDSAVTAALLREAHWRVLATWVDLGQPARARERTASSAIAKHFGLQWSPITVSPFAAPPHGEIPGRNDLLVTLALASAPKTPVAIGVHAGSPYPDNSPQWFEAWTDLLDVEYGGKCGVMAPLLGMQKSEVIGLAQRLNVPLGLTYSCEAADDPCGTCASCLDRWGLDHG